MTLIKVERVGKGKISRIRGVYRDFLRQQWLIHTRRGLKEIAAGDIVIRTAFGVSLVPISRLFVNG